MKEKSARLAQLNIELNIDERSPLEAAIDDTETRTPTAEMTKSERPSILERLRAPLPSRNNANKQNEKGER